MASILTNVTHEDVLNCILEANCWNPTDDGWGGVYNLDLCCMEVEIEARVVKPFPDTQYEIRKVTIK